MLPREGKAYHGDLMLDDEFHACFVERSGRHDTRIFDGKHITLTYRAEDGRMRFNFKQMVITPRFGLRDLCQRGGQGNTHRYKWPRREVTHSIRLSVTVTVVTVVTEGQLIAKPPF